MSIKQRVERVEERLGFDQDPVRHEIVHFGGPLPPDEQRGNVVVRHVAYESIRERQEGGGGA
ncbi:MAG: hypothetical protein WC655_13940 [Candidatus Hydrogenedentales bacterium]|jgi:hypothetical protein